MVVESVVWSHFKNLHNSSRKLTRAYKAHDQPVEHDDILVLMTDDMSWNIQSKGEEVFSKCVNPYMKGTELADPQASSKCIADFGWKAKAENFYCTGPMEKQDITVIVAQVKTDQK